MHRLCLGGIETETQNIAKVLTSYVFRVEAAKPSSNIWLIPNM